MTAGHRLPSKKRVCAASSRSVSRTGKRRVKFGQQFARKIFLASQPLGPDLAENGRSDLSAVNPRRPVLCAAKTENSEGKHENSSWPPHRGLFARFVSPPRHRASAHCRRRSPTAYGLA